MMYEGWTKDYHKYKNLFYPEYDIVKTFHQDFDPTRLSKYIRENSGHITPGMFDFLDDVLAKKVYPLKGQKKSHTERNIGLFIEVYSLVGHRGGMNLTSNSEKDGAACIVAKRHNLSESTVIKAYQYGQDELKKEGYIHRGGTFISDPDSFDPATDL